MCNWCQEHGVHGRSTHRGGAADLQEEAIVDAPRPQNQSEVRSVLGSAQFCAKFIPGFSTISSLLWNLTCTGTSWKWGTKEDEAFDEIKKLLTNAPVMAYFAKDA